MASAISRKQFEHVSFFLTETDDETPPQIVPVEKMGTFKWSSDNPSAVLTPSADTLACDAVSDTPFTITAVSDGDPSLTDSTLVNITPPAPKTLIMSVGVRPS